MEYAQVVRNYKHFRKVSFDLGKRLVESLTREELDDAARDLGMLRNGVIVLQTEDESSVLMDYAIANIVRGGRTALDRMLEEDPPPEGSAEMQALRAWRDSHYTILDIQQIVPRVGVRALDGPEKTPIFLVDLGFSQTAIPGMAVASRIYSPVEGWWMSTGAALPINERALEMFTSDWARFKQRHGREPDDRQFARLVTRACVAARTSQQIAYADARDNAKVSRRSLASPPSPEDPGSDYVSVKLGRNDPCPCGSGKKYKKCCGLFPGRAM